MRFARAVVLVLGMPPLTTDERMNTLKESKGPPHGENVVERRQCQEELIKLTILAMSDNFKNGSEGT